MWLEPKLVKIGDIYLGQKNVSIENFIPSFKAQGLIWQMRKAKKGKYFVCDVTMDLREQKCINNGQLKK
jgi:hypothetical protein